jgi:MYXO-CTERM domain-containing protein
LTNPTEPNDPFDSTDSNDPTDPTDPTGAERVQVSGESKSVTGCSARPAQGSAAWLLAPAALALVVRRRRR